MKHLLTLFLSICFIFSSTIPTEAKSPDTYTANYTEYIGDGLYAEVELSVTQTENDISFFNNNSLYSISGTRASTRQKTSSKTYRIKNKLGTVVATYKLTGTFQYNGSSSACKSASCSTSVLDSNYYFSSKSASKSGNTATGSFTLSSSESTISKTLTITCSSNGTIQ